MTEPTGYKTRKDGSIDTAHYMAHGRALRSTAFLKALARLRPGFPRPQRRAAADRRHAGQPGVPAE